VSDSSASRVESRVESRLGEIARVSVTPAAAAEIRRLRAAHGPLLFHQSGGCCDGSAPMCYPRSDFRVGQRDVFLGAIEDTPFYMGAAQFEYWRHTHLTIDVVPGRGSGFSLEAPDGIRFITRSRLFDEDEWRGLEGVEVARGEQSG
jgi:uncharacterized protein (DUF779 family)